MNIVFVVPKAKEAFTPYGPPLGMCYIASCLRKAGYPKLEGIDLNVSDIGEFTSAAKDADVLCIYASTKTFTSAVELADRAKEFNAKCKVVMGGPHPTLCPEEVLENQSVDFIVIGEGEVSVSRLVRVLDRSKKTNADVLNRELGKIKSLGFRSGGKVTINERESPVKNLDSLPFPDRDLFDIRKYPTRSVTVAASRGCPYQCTNCQPALTKICGPFRFRSVDNVIREIKELESQGFEMLHFVDNDLTVGKKWMPEFCRKMVENKIKIKWGCQGRLNTIDKDMMELMKKAGSVNLSMGIESGSPVVVNKILKKGIDLKKVKAIMPKAREIDLPVHVWFMIGIPGETKENIEETIGFVSDLDVMSIGFSIGTPWPGTGFSDIAKEKQWFDSSGWDDLNEKRHGVLKTDSFNERDIEEYREKIIELFKKKNWLVNEGDMIFTNPFYGKSFKRRVLAAFCKTFGTGTVYKLRGKIRSV